MNFYTSTFLCLLAVALLADVIYGYPSRRHHTREHQQALDALDNIFTVMESEDTFSTDIGRRSNRRRGRRDAFPRGGLHYRRMCLRILSNRERYPIGDVRTCIRYFVHIEAIRRQPDNVADM